MRKKKDKMTKDLMTISDKEVSNLQEQHYIEIESNPEFSLDIDPMNKYHFGSLETTFLREYVQWKSVPRAAEFSGMDIEEAKTFFLSYNCQQEIRRLNRAMYQRSFNKKLITIDEIGGYLSAILTDEIPYADRVSTRDKVGIAKMIVDLNLLKREALDNPSRIMNQNINIELKSLSVKTIKNMLAAAEKTDTSEKQELIDKLDADNQLSPEELSYISTLSTNEILALLEEINNGGNE